jgi:hypothetical protein
MKSHRISGAAVGIMLCLTAAGARAQSLDWVRQDGGPLFLTQEANAIAVDSLGNSYVAGTFRTMATFGVGDPNETVLTGVGAQDIFVAKYDPRGRLLWARSAGGGSFHQDWAFGIAVDAAGNSYATGFFAGISGVVNFGNGVTLDGGGAFVVKYDTGGTPVWATTLDSNGVAWGIAADAGGHSFVAGATPAPGNASPTVTVWKVGTDGTELWTRMATGVYSGNAIGVSVGPNGDSVVTGEIQGGTAVFGTGEANETSVTGLNTAVMFVAKYDPAGNLIWAQQSLDEAGFATRGNAIASDSAGNSYVVGVGPTILGSGANAIEVSMYIAKYDAAGNLAWAHSVSPGFGQVSWLFAVAHSATGHTYLTGTSIQGNVFIEKYSDDGARLWGRRLATITATDVLALQGNGISTDPAGNTYVAGNFSSSVLFGPGEPNETLLSTTSANQDFDIFVAKYLTDAPAGNTPPVAAGQDVTTPEDTPIVIALAATDADGDPLTYTIVAPPAHGDLVPNFPDVTYTPHPNYNGPDSFTFRASDSQAQSNVATVSITITPVNDAPIAHGQVRSTPRNTPLALTLTGADVDGDPLGFSVVAGPAHGTLAGIGADRTYTPNVGYTGPDSFTFTASDTVAVSAPATVAITVVSTDLVCGSLTSGTIAGPGQIDQYLFAGAAGQLISLALASTGGFATNTGSLSATMTVVAPSGAVVGTLRSNSLNNFRLPESGTYVVRVRATNNSAVGSYNLNFECLYPEQSPDAVALGCGALAFGTLEARAEVDLYSFTGSSGQLIALTLASTGGFATNTGSLSVTATLFAPSGALVGSVRSNSQANFVLPATGTYVVRAHATNLATTGSYNLNFECLYPEQSPGTFALGCGALASGAIAASGEVDLYSFVASAGQLISLTLASTGGFATNTGSFSATATLFAPSGAPSGSVRTNSQANFVVPAAGTYVVRVHATNLATLGSYNLNFECMYPVQSPGDELPCGALASETIEARGEVDLYSFAGSTGQLIALTLASTGGFATNTGSLSATATLFAPSGAPVGSVRTNGQANFVLPATGTYVVRVHATNFGTTGSYNVNLECLYPEQSPGTAELACGALASGALEGRGEVDLYSFLGSTGELVSFTLASTGGFATNTGSLSATLTVFAPSGAVLGSVRTNSPARWVLSETGKYVARVHATNLGTLGSYNLNLECLSPTLSPDAGILTCGASAAANIAASGEVDLYSFDSTAGRPVSLTLISTGGFATNTGSNSVALTLLSPSGAAIGALRSNSTGSFVLPETGPYVVGINATSLARTGSYVVTLSCAPN